MKKNSEWQRHFNEFVESNMNKPFAWGKWDCCIFANACIKSMTGKDVIPKSLKWKDEKTAMQSIEDYGKTLVKSVAKACKQAKLKEINKNFVSTGDLVVFQGDKTQITGVSDGFKIVAVTEDGFGFADHDKIIRVWRINDV